jgi:hypothetical protein
LNQELDFGLDVKREKKDMGQFLRKVTLNKNQESNLEKMGFIQNLYKKLSLNELAAKGIELSVKDKLIEYIKQQQDQTLEQKQVLQKL